MFCLEAFMNKKTDFNPHWGTIQETSDPEYFYDLKLLFRQKSGHWKAVKQYRITHYNEDHDNKYRMDGEINYIKDATKLYNSDISWFIKAYPDMKPSEASNVFCSKYAGYLNVYGIEWTERAINNAKSQSYTSQQMED